MRDRNKWRVRQVTVVGIPMGWGVLEPENYYATALYARRYPTWQAAFEAAIEGARNDAEATA